MIPFCEQNPWQIVYWVVWLNVCILRKGKRKKTVNEYITHCAREYLLAKALREQARFDYSGRRIPRLIDTYMLCANK